MNQLTTIASLPSGGGCKSAMTAEVGKTYVIGDFTPQEIAAAQAESTGIYAFEEGGLVRIGTASIAGEQGPEVFVPPIIKIVQSITVGDEATASQVRNAVAGARRRVPRDKVAAHSYADRFKYDERN